MWIWHYDICIYRRFARNLFLSAGSPGDGLFGQFAVDMMMRYLIKEFQRIKEEENNRYEQLKWELTDKKIDVN
jgi:hypothetical protein